MGTRSGDGRGLKGPLSRRSLASSHCGSLSTPFTTASAPSSSGLPFRPHKVFLSVLRGKRQNKENRLKATTADPVRRPSASFVSSPSHTRAYTRTHTSLPLARLIREAWQTLRPSRQRHRGERCPTALPALRFSSACWAPRSRSWAATPPRPSRRRQRCAPGRHERGEWEREREGEGEGGKKSPATVIDFSSLFPSSSFISLSLFPNIYPRCLCIYLSLSPLPLSHKCHHRKPPRPVNRVARSRFLPLSLLSILSSLAAPHRAPA